MKETTIKRIKSAISVLRHLVHMYPESTELLEEQIASLEQVIENIKDGWKESEPEMLKAEGTIGRIFGDIHENNK